MNFIIYIVAYPLLWLLSILPFRIFYWVSDCLFVLVFYVVRYRRKTVQENLRLALPKLSDSERKTIERKFYHYMCDMFLEMVKTLTISEEEMSKRYVFTNIELVQELEKTNKSIILFCAHYASWEWMIIMGKYINSKGFGIYKKIQNPYFDRLIHKIRSRFNAELIDTSHTIKAVLGNESKGIKGVYAFVSDQSPMLVDANFWVDFMNMEVPVHTGGEALAKKLDMHALYLKVERVGRGYYQATFVPLAEEVKKVPNYDITVRFIREVEKQIHAAPEYYFWTHKRWKHRGKNPKK